MRRSNLFEHNRSEQWGSVSNALELESYNYVQHKDYQLHVLHKVEKLPANRPVIPTTEGQRLAYIRGFATSPYRTMINYTQQMDFGRFLWSYVCNVILRSLPLNYIHVFLASYSPDEHLFVSKMIPLFYGVSWQVIFAGIIQLVACVDVLSLFLHYALYGVFASSRYDQCKPDDVFTGIPGQPKLQCYPMSKFTALGKHLKFNKWVVTPGDANKGEVKESITFSGHAYIHTIKNDTFIEDIIFLPSPQSYFLNKWEKNNVLRLWTFEWLPYYVFLWVAAGCFYKQIYRQYLWKLLTRMQLLCNVIYLIAVFDIGHTFFTSDEERSMSYNSEKTAEHTMAIKIGLKLDFDMIAECVIGPPVIQLLYSRSGQQVNPGRDSALITLSNGMFYLFRCLTNTLMMTYINQKTGLPIMISWLCNYPIFYQWNYYTANVLIGAIIIRVFFIFTFCVEFLIFVITYQLLVETVVCEWKWARRWNTSLIISFVGLVLSASLLTKEKSTIYLLSVMVTALTESVVIMWLYPLGRLMDDIYFHVGTPIGTFRQWTYRIIPLFYMYKFAAIYETAGVTQDYERHKGPKSLGSAFADTTNCLQWGIWPCVILLIVGMLYAMVKYLLALKQNWRVLIRPRPDWGPRDHVIRQLRKQFDSRDYIGSQASRYLSRHMLVKSQTPTYRLDLRYETPSERRRSTIVLDNFDFGEAEARRLTAIYETPEQMAPDKKTKSKNEEDSDEEIYCS